MASFSSDGSDCIKRIITIAQSDNLNKCGLSDLIVQFDIKEVCEWINSNGYKKICLQFPDELLQLSDKVYEAIKNKVEADVYILADTTYSSCCVDEVTAMHVKADAIVHYGHSCLSMSSIPVFISLPKHSLDVNLLVKILHNYCLNFGEVTKLCLFYDAAYDHLKDAISDMWFKINPSGYIASVDRSKHEDSVVGRLLTNWKGSVLKHEDINGFTCLYIGTQSQTLFNCVISVNAQWVLLDTKSLKIQSLDESAWFKRRRYLIEKCKDANSIGILVCKLSGNTTSEIIKRMKYVCKKSHKKSYIISVGKPNVAKLANFPEIDLYVLIACPENDLYSSRDFYKPLVYPYELEVALNDNRPNLYNVHITDFEYLLENKRHYCQFYEQEEKSDVSLISGKIRQTRIYNYDSDGKALEKTQWAVQGIGENLNSRSWSGLEQKLGETSVKEVEPGRSGLPISYENEPKD